MKKVENNWNEVSRRCALADHDGLACGPFSMTSVEAELVITEDGETKYLHSSWVSEAPESISFEINSESIFDILSSDGDIDQLERIRSASIEKYGEVSFDAYTNQILELKKMIIEKITEEQLFEDEELAELIEEFEN